MRVMSEMRAKNHWGLFSWESIFSSSLDPFLGAFSRRSGLIIWQSIKLSLLSFGEFESFLFYGWANTVCLVFIVTEVLQWSLSSISWLIVNTVSKSSLNIDIIISISCTPSHIVGFGVIVSTVLVITAIDFIFFFQGMEQTIRAVCAGQVCWAITQNLWISSTIGCCMLVRLIVSHSW